MAERVTEQQERVYCPPVDVGELVYVRNRSPGKNKIQDAWAAAEDKVVDVQGTTYTVEPLEGGLVKRVWRFYYSPAPNLPQRMLTYQQMSRTLGLCLIQGKKKEGMSG